MSGVSSKWVVRRLPYKSLGGPSGGESTGWHMLATIAAMAFQYETDDGVVEYGVEQLRDLRTWANGEHTGREHEYVWT